jgi:hypothetical protein
MTEETKTKAANILIILAYFIITIVCLGSMGAWLPLVIDDYNLGCISSETYGNFASNILTYSLSIFLVAVIDRIIHLLFKTSTYSSNIIEFFFIIFMCISAAFIVYLSLRAIKRSLIDEAITYSYYVAVVAGFAWIYVKLQGTKANNFATIGGVI